MLCPDDAFPINSIHHAVSFSSSVEKRQLEVRHDSFCDVTNNSFLGFGLITGLGMQGARVTIEFKKSARKKVVFSRHHTTTNASLLAHQDIVCVADHS